MPAMSCPKRFCSLLDFHFRLFLPFSVFLVLIMTKSLRCGMFPGFSGIFCFFRFSKTLHQRYFSGSVHKSGKSSVLSFSSPNGAPTDRRRFFCRPVQTGVGTRFLRVSRLKFNLTCSNPNTLFMLFSFYALSILKLNLASNSCIFLSVCNFNTQDQSISVVLFNFINRSPI